MIRIRIGKDISLRWKIRTNGQEKSLIGRDLKLIIASSSGGKRELEFGITENAPTTIKTIYYGKDQQTVGDYSLILYENYGKKSMTALDIVNAFTLVKVTEMESDLTYDSEAANPMPVVELEGNIQTMGYGLSAFEIAVINGFVGTETEWLDSLRGADGVNGIDGKDGKDGKNGIDGKDGKDGDQGPKGDKGDKGADGSIIWPKMSVDASGFLVADVPDETHAHNFSLDDAGFLCLDVPDVN